MSIFDSLFGTYGGNAQNTMKKAQKDIKNAYNPYMEAGKKTIPQLQGLYGQLTQNPGQFYNQIGQNFQESPGFQWSVDQATNAANNAGAASGMAGSPAVQNALAQQVMGMANQDYYNYMGGATGMFNQGLQGLQGMNQTGFNAAHGYASNLADMQKALAQLQYSRGANQSNAIGGLVGGIAGRLGF